MSANEKILKEENATTTALIVSDKKDAEVVMRPFNWHGFKMILQSTQDDLIEYFNSALPSLYGEENVYSTKDFIYAKGDIPVLFVAHMDTVHTSMCDDVYYDQEVGHIWSPQGCGGDDRCGVLVNLYMATHFGDKRPHILFTTDEERGCIGAGIAAKDSKLKEWQKSLKYIVEFDRKGSDDAVFYGCQNEKFHKYVTSFGFKKATGSCSDISRLCPKDAWDIAGVNISSGYYNAHSTSEYIRIKELWENIRKVIIMVMDCDNVERFNYGDIVKTYSKSTTTTHKPTGYYGHKEENMSEEEIYNLLVSQISRNSGVSEDDLKDPFYAT